MQIIFQIIFISTSSAYLIANYTCDCSFHSEELECTNVVTCDWVNEGCQKKDCQDIDQKFVIFKVDVVQIMITIVKKLKLVQHISQKIKQIVCFLKEIVHIRTQQMILLNINAQHILWQIVHQHQIIILVIIRILLDLPIVGGTKPELVKNIILIRVLEYLITFDTLAGQTEYWPIQGKQKKYSIL